MKDKKNSELVPKVQVLYTVLLGGGQYWQDLLTTATSIPHLGSSTSETSCMRDN